MQSPASQLPALRIGSTHKIKKIPILISSAGFSRIAESQFQPRETKYTVSMERQLSFGKSSPHPRIGNKSSAELFDIVGNLPEDILGEVIVYLAEQHDLQKLISWQAVSVLAGLFMFCLE